MAFNNDSKKSDDKNIQIAELEQLLLNSEYSPNEE